MRKLIAVSLVLSLLLCGCESENTEPVPEISEIVTTEVETTTEEPTTEELTIEEPDSHWRCKKDTDEFGDELPNGSKYALGAFIGTFSNSATNSSDLTVGIVVDDFDFQIIMLEYGKLSPSFLSSDTITIKAKNDDGTVKEYSNKNLDFYVSDSGTIVFYSTSKSPIQDVINNKNLKFIITESSKYGSSSEYRFNSSNVGLRDVILNNDIDSTHRLITVNESVNSDKEGKWHTSPWKDVFKKSKEDGDLLWGDFYGTYTHNKGTFDVTAQIMITDSVTLVIKLLENGNTPASVSPDDDIKITIVTDKTRIELSGYNIDNGAVAATRKDLIKSIADSSNTTITIEIKTVYENVTTYKFKVHNNNLPELIDKVKYIY